LSPNAEHWLAAADTAITDVPRPVAAVVRVHNLQRAQPGSVQFDGGDKMHGWLRDLDDLDERAAAQRNLLAGRWRVSVHEVKRDIVQQTGGLCERHPGHD
jgi:hypothetical protein